MLYRVPVMKKSMLFSALCAAALLASGCSSTPNIDQSIAEVDLARQGSANTPADLANPDEMAYCLLPGKVRNLGTRMVYVSPRKRVLSTRVECDIRGGEILVDGSGSLTSEQAGS